MAFTRHQLRDLHDDPLHQVLLTAPPATTAPWPTRRAWAAEPGAVSLRWRRGLGAGWIVVYTLAVLLEPAPADPGATDPLWSVALFLGLTAALVAMGVGLARGRRVGLLAGVGAAGLALVGAVMCPVSGHHAGVGAWWYLQMAGFVGLMAATLVGLRRTRPGPNRR